MTTSPEPAQLNGRGDIVAATVAPSPSSDDHPEPLIPKIDGELLVEQPDLPVPLAATDESDEETLEDLASQIKQAHFDLTRASAAVVAFAVEAGRLLLKARPRVASGEWEKWIEKHCSFSVRRAQEYVQLNNSPSKGK